ncbi:MAG: hypothetical protein FD166_3651, partial [Bacteroidetes bacterium]
THSAVDGCSRTETASTPAVAYYSNTAPPAVVITTSINLQYTSQYSNLYSTTFPTTGNSPNLLKPQYNPSPNRIPSSFPTSSRPYPPVSDTGRSNTVNIIPSGGLPNPLQPSSSELYQQFLETRRLEEERIRNLLLRPVQTPVSLPSGGPHSDRNRPAYAEPLQLSNSSSGIPTSVTADRSLSASGLARLGLSSGSSAGGSEIGTSAPIPSRVILKPEHRLGGGTSMDTGNTNDVRISPVILDQMIKQKLQEIGIKLDKKQPLLSRTELENRLIEPVRKPTRFEIETQFGDEHRTCTRYISSGISDETDRQTNTLVPDQNFIPLLQGLHALNARGAGTFGVWGAGQRIGDFDLDETLPKGKKIYNTIYRGEVRKTHSRFDADGRPVELSEHIEPTSTQTGFHFQGIVVKPSGRFVRESDEVDPMEIKPDVPVTETVRPTEPAVTAIPPVVTSKPTAGLSIQEIIQAAMIGYNMRGGQVAAETPSSEISRTGSFLAPPPVSQYIPSFFGTPCPSLFNNPRIPVPPFSSKSTTDVHSTPVNSSNQLADEDMMMGWGTGISTTTVPSYGSEYQQPVSASAGGPKIDSIESLSNVTLSSTISTTYTDSTISKSIEDISHRSAVTQAGSMGFPNESGTGWRSDTNTIQTGNYDDSDDVPMSLHYDDFVAAQQTTSHIQLTHASESSTPHRPLTGYRPKSKIMKLAVSTPVIPSAISANIGTGASKTTKKFTVSVLSKTTPQSGTSTSSLSSSSTLTAAPAPAITAP